MIWTVKYNGAGVYYIRNSSWKTATTTYTRSTREEAQELADRLNAEREAKASQTAADLDDMLRRLRAMLYDPANITRLTTIQATIRNLEAQRDTLVVTKEDPPMTTTPNRFYRVSKSTTGKRARVAYVSAPTAEAAARRHVLAGVEVRKVAEDRFQPFVVRADGTTVDQGLPLVVTATELGK